MALARVKSWISGEVLTASDLNAEYNNILNNGADLVSPFTKAISMGGFSLNFDAASTIALTATTNGVGLTGGALNTAQGADIVAAATLNLDTATGNTPDVTGNTGITAVTLSQGRTRLVRFTGTPTITNGASLVVEGGADFTAVAGQYVLFVGYASSVVRCIPFTTPAATQTLTNKTLTSPAITGGTLTAPTITNAANTTQALTDQATITWDASAGAVATVTLAGSRTMAAPTNLKAGGRYTLIVTEDGTGGRTLTWNTVFKGQGGALMPQPDTTAGAVSVFEFTSDATNLYCAQSTPFIDTNYFVRGSVDATKKVRFEVDGLTTATTRVITMPDTDVTLVAVATQAEQETSTSITTAVSPGRQQFHPSAAKGWGKINTAGGADASYNVTSVTDNGTGDALVVWNVDFSAADHVTVATAFVAAAAQAIRVSSLAAGQDNVICFTTTTGAAVDPTCFLVVAFGDQP